VRESCLVFGEEAGMMVMVMTVMVVMVMTVMVMMAGG
jgi:hypothetical protein